MAGRDDTTLVAALTCFLLQLSAITGETVSACFGTARKDLAISCGTGYMLRITKAFYGYSNSGRCYFTPGDCTQGEHESYPCTGSDSCSINLPTGSYGQKLINCDKYSNYFQVEYSCEPVIHTVDICRVSTLTAQRGFISSPKFPNNYPDNVDCLTHITVHPSQNINITIIDMDLEINGTYGCHDWLYAFNQHRSVTLCGRRTNEKLTTLQSNDISIRFQSDWRNNKKGFWLYYEAYPPLPATYPPQKTSAWVTEGKVETKAPTVKSSTIPAPSEADRQTSSNNSKDSKERLPFVAIVAGVIGSLTFILIILLILLVCRWWQDKRSYRHKSQHVEYLDARNPAYRSSTGTEFQGVEVYYNC